MSEIKKLEVDGVFGEKTEAVILDFQEDNGLYADGIIGPNTLEALEDAYYDGMKERDVPSSGLFGEEEFFLERLLADKYGERFYRMWRYYLLSCAGAFRSRDLNLLQFSLTNNL